MRSPDGLQPERTRLAWSRTGLALAAVWTVLSRHSPAFAYAVLAGGAAAAAWTAWMNSFRVRSGSVIRGAPPLTIAAVAVATVACGLYALFVVAF